MKKAPHNNDRLFSGKNWIIYNDPEREINTDKKPVKIPGFSVFVYL